MPEYREIAVSDMDSIFEVRVATRENAYSMQELERLGITPETVTEMLSEGFRGWLCEEGGRTVGFAMGNSGTGEMWVIAVLPEYEGRGIGSRLISLVERWLAAEGWSESWLTTDVDTSLRAYGFYLHEGWRDDVVRDGLRYMRKSLAV
jgi:GNAT superfamily N-acetyltransferase